MPTYTYKCKDCGHQFDVRQKFSEDALTDCPVCVGKLRRLVNNSGGIVFKGSGFYINDSKTGSKSKSSAVPSSSSKTSEDGEKSSKSDSASSSEKGSDSKSTEKSKEKSSSTS